MSEFMLCATMGLNGFVAMGDNSCCPSVHEAGLSRSGHILLHDVHKSIGDSTSDLIRRQRIRATGSEMNSGAVISRKETAEKYPFYSNYPVFSILDPTRTSAHNYPVYEEPRERSLLKYGQFLLPICP